VAKSRPRYRFTEKAESDLEGIIEYTVQQWGGSQVDTYLDGLETLAKLLADNPDLGIKRQALSEGLLSFPYESHIVYYMKHRRGITIVRVLHQHTDPLKHL
jgi:toxin ParE1/3/4